MLDSSPTKVCEWHKFLIDAVDLNSLKDQSISTHMPLCRIPEWRRIDRRYVARFDFDVIATGVFDYALLVGGLKILSELLANEITGCATYSAFAH